MTTVVKVSFVHGLGSTASSGSANVTLYDADQEIIKEGEILIMAKTTAPVAEFEILVPTEVNVSFVKVSRLLGEELFV